ncbi:hypothetical protein QJS04_geneDACA001334 [Acorus gramineus]|uniref:Uncharacterized protein n=1 Tax=Acorus gramineus TaxID=55184 RepID=A0AAV9ADX6_ACOGR|nr:hypothetical protein QJS04_geneDACA001334 [Acorus gramineus]
MINSKKLIEMARKWHRTTSSRRRRRRRISLGRGQTSITNKGHFVVYSGDGERFVIPLGYLDSTIFKRLLRMSEEEFGLPGIDGPITLPFDGAVMKYVLFLLERRASVSRCGSGALLVSIAAGRCSMSCLPSQGQILFGQQLVYIFAILDS